MVRKSNTDRANDAPAISKETKLPSNGSEALAVQVRILGPEDETKELTSLLSKHGFAPTGTEPEDGRENRLRTYMVRPVKRVKAATIPEPVKPSQSKEILEKRKAELQAEIEKAILIERTALTGIDPTALIKAKQNVAAISEMSQHVTAELERWAAYEKEFAEFQSIKKHNSDIQHFKTTRYLCEDFGHPLVFDQIVDRRGLMLQGDGWKKASDYRYLVRFVCKDCNSYVLRSAAELYALEKSQAGKPEGKGRPAIMETWPQ